MIDPKRINEMVQKVMDSLPAGLKNLPADLEKNLRSAMNAAFNKMDLVTREEFDAQTKVLQKTRSKLEELEKKIKMLETRKN